MRSTKRYGQLLLAAVFSFVMVFAALAPAYAADPTGKVITAVQISGNGSIAAEQIQQVIKAKPGDVVAADKIKQDMQAIYDLGYFFDVVSNFTDVPEGVQVTYTVMENPVLKEVAVKGNTKVSTEKIVSALNLETGKILNSKQLNTNVKAVEESYREQGYILAKVSDVSMQPNGTLTLTINEGMLEGIVVKGNDKTKTNVITREMKVKPGEAFNVKDAKRSMQKVYNLGFFEDVNMKLNPGREPNAVVLETSVVEQKTGTFSIGGGYSEADGMIGIIELGDKNFRGTGDSVKIHWEFGGYADGNKNYQFSYTKPWLDAKQTSLGFSIYNMTNRYTDYNDDGDSRATYDKRRKGWDITLGRPQGEYVQNYITLKNRQDSFVKWKSGANYDDPADPFIQQNPNYLLDNFGTTHSVILNRVYDSRDNVFNPTEGNRWSLSAELAGRGLGGDFTFNKYTAETRNYWDVGSNHVIATRVMAGYADGKMPESGRFAVGGSESLRGYRDDQFKGDKMFLATAEYRLPIVKKVDGAVFVDAGNAWGDSGDNQGYKLDNLKVGYGVGLRVATPLGPIRLDVAKGDQGVRTHFSFGGQF